MLVIGPRSCHWLNILWHRILSSSRPFLLGLPQRAAVQARSTPTPTILIFREYLMFQIYSGLGDMFRPFWSLLRLSDHYSEDHTAGCKYWCGIRRPFLFKTLCSKSTGANSITLHDQNVEIFGTFYFNRWCVYRWVLIYGHLIASVPLVWVCFMLNEIVTRMRSMLRLIGSYASANRAARYTKRTFFFS